jgi:hypothetical protein
MIAVNRANRPTLAALLCDVTVSHDHHHWPFFRMPAMIAIFFFLHFSPPSGVPPERRQLVSGSFGI